MKSGNKSALSKDECDNFEEAINKLSALSQPLNQSTIQQNLDEIDQISQALLNKINANCKSVFQANRSLTKMMIV